MTHPDEKCDRACKKHPCPDCVFCQQCSETRCNACRGKKNKALKMTVAEQIQRFETLNHELQAPEEPVYYSKTAVPSHDK